MNTLNPERFFPYALAALLALVLVGVLMWPKPDAPVGVSAPLPAAKEVRTIERIIERPKIVYVYPDRVKDDLDLPADVAKDPAKKVTATGKLDADDRPYTMTAVLDVGTGESQVYARPDPLPWIARRSTSEIGLFAGYLGGEQAIRIEGRQEVLRIKALHLGAVGSADITPGDIDGFVGIGAWGRW